MKWAVCGLAATLLLAFAGRAEAAYVIVSGSDPANNPLYNLLLNDPALSTDGTTVRGHLQSTKEVLDIQALNGETLHPNGGQASVEPVDGDLGAFELLAHTTGGLPAPYINTSYFRALGFDLTLLTGPGTLNFSALTIKVSLYRAADNLLEKTQSFAGNDIANSGHFDIYAGAPADPALGRVVVEIFQTSNMSAVQPLASVRQIKFNGTPGLDPQGNGVVPEPTSLALAGFAGIGMAFSALRRRQQKSPTV